MDSKERDQLGQAVKGLSAAVCTVNEGAEDCRREAAKEKGQVLCLLPRQVPQLGSLDMAHQAVPQMRSDLPVQHSCPCRKQSQSLRRERKAEIVPSCSQGMGCSTIN